LFKDYANLVMLYEDFIYYISLSIT
jgi:hypothetical protein